MRESKVIFVNRFFFPDHSATSQILSDLAFDLAAAGSTVEVITSRLRYDDPGALLPREERLRGVRVHRVATSRLGRGSLLGRALDYLTFYASAAWALWALATPEAVVVAKTDPPLLSIVAAPIARVRGARLVNWLQDLFPEVASALGVRLVRGPVLGVLRWARDRSLLAAASNVVLGERMRELVLARGVPAEKIVVVPNWADGEAVRPLPPGANPLRSAWSLDGRFVVAYSGNLGRAHEFDTILDAAELLRDRADVAFLFVGGGAQRAAVEAEARRRGLTSVLFRPYQPREHLSQSLGVGDVHLVSLNPALEGLIVPSKFYGIAAAGRPTLFIGDLDGEVARVVRAARCGQAVATGDGAGLAAWIRRLADAPAERDELGANARAALEALYDRRVAFEAWRAVLARAGAATVPDRRGGP